MRGGEKAGIPTVRVVIVQHLKTQRQPVNCKALEDVVIKERPDLVSKNLGATIRSVIQRAPEISRPSLGLYSLHSK